MGDVDEQWWFNPQTGEVERGRLEPWTRRMGPYPTREAAAAAFDTAAARTEAFDDAEEAWDKAWDPEGDDD